jgi:FkbM family methyltransferase
MIYKKIKRKLQEKVCDLRYPFTWHNAYFGVDFHIHNRIEKFRIMEWGGEKKYVIDLISHLNENDVFYDIGTSVGLISILAAQKLKDGKVIGFEPDPENIDRLKANFALNELHNYMALNFAIGEAKGKLKLFTKGADGFSPSLQPVNGIDSFIEVDVYALDPLISERNLPLPTVVKMDIEGAEFMALKGMRKLLTIQEKPRLLFIELHPEFLPAFNSSIEEVIQFLSELNYSIEERIERDNQVLCKLKSIA